MRLDLFLRRYHALLEFLWPDELLKLLWSELWLLFVLRNLPLMKRTSKLHRHRTSLNLKIPNVYPTRLRGFKLNTTTTTAASTPPATSYH